MNQKQLCAVAAYFVQLARVEQAEIYRQWFEFNNRPDSSMTAEQGNNLLTREQWLQSVGKGFTLLKQHHRFEGQPACNKKRAFQNVSELGRYLADALYKATSIEAEQDLRAARDFLADFMPAAPQTLSIMEPWSEPAILS